jgi:hypothetical protein
MPGLTYYIRVLRVLFATCFHVPLFELQAFLFVQVYLKFEKKAKQHHGF